ncbi:Hypothetical protein, putative, partial [Bodo saltans]
MRSHSASVARLFVLLFYVLVPSTSRIQLPLTVSAVTSVAYPYGLDVNDDGTIFFTSYYSCTIHKLPPSGGSAQLVGGSYGSCGFADGSSALFWYPIGMSRDAANNVMYIADQYNNRIRVMNLATYSVTTLFGSVVGSTNGPFSAALLYYCTDVAFRSTSNGLQRLLYIADWFNGMIRKADLITAIVSTLASTPGGISLVLSRSGLLIFIASDTSISSVDTTTGNVTLLAGAYGTCSFANGVGIAARFCYARGVALNHDETLLFIGDAANYRLRQIVLSNLSVTTLAGNGVASSVNEPLLNSTFVGPRTAKWYCNRLSSVCGILVADYDPTGTIRWIPITPASISKSVSAPTNENTKTLSNLTTPTMSRPTTTQQFSKTLTIVHTPSHSPITHDSLSRTALPTMSRSHTLSSTETQQSPRVTPSASHTLTPTATSTSDVTATKSPPTRTKSSTLFDCDAQAPKATGVMLVGVNLLTMPPTQLRNTSAPLALTGANTANASYASHREVSQIDPPLVFLSTQGVNRVALLQAPPLTFNLTLVSPFQLLYYYVGNVTTFQGTSTSATWSVRPRSGVWHSIVVQPPSIGWVDAVPPVLVYREMNLLVPLLCGDGRPM